jgi:hypothetical protein
MTGILQRWWFWLSATVIVGGLTLLALCWSHRTWSVNEWRVYKAMDQECHPAWRDFHYGRIRAGDDVKQVIASTQPKRIERSGRWVVLYYQGGDGLLHFTGLTAAAYDGQMVCAFAWSDTWLRQFFDIMSEEQRKEFFREYWDQLARLGNPIIVR